MAATATVNPKQLTKSDHCDQGDCNAAASVRAVMPKGGELMFCAHHLKGHQVRLDEVGATLHA